MNANSTYLVRIGIFVIVNRKLLSQIHKNNLANIILNYFSNTYSFVAVAHIFVTGQ